MNSLQFLTAARLIGFSTLPVQKTFNKAMRRITWLARETACREEQHVRFYRQRELSHSLIQEQERLPGDGWESIGLCAR